MVIKPANPTRLYVLDTNVIMHDPYSMLQFHEHDVYLPMVVLEELDAGKKGITEVARNVRQANRLLDELIVNKTHKEISEGIQLSPIPNSGGNMQSPHGRLFFQTSDLAAKLPQEMPGNKPDNKILATTLALQLQFPKIRVTLVSKDINLRIKAGILGIHAEDYFNDRVIDDISLLHQGIHRLPENFWETHGKDLHSWQEEGRTFYKVTGPAVQGWYPNDCLYMESEEPFEAIVRSVQNNVATIEYAKDYMHQKHAVWGVLARNREQNFALNQLMDPNIDLVILQGSAGSGKTLLTLAAGLVQTLDLNRYREIIMTRVTVPLGEDIGFLPGTEEDKMTPWMGALMDNLEVLHATQEGGDWGWSATNDLLRSRLKIRSLNYMRGRTFLNKYLIIDEAQNLTSKQLKTLITRAGPGTKIVCMGDIRQIDTPYLSETNSGLTNLIDRFKECPYSANVTLLRGERSRLADYAANKL